MSVPGADPRVLGPYLARELDDARWAAPAVEVVAGGRSNLTYYVSSPAGSVVLRRPPLRAVRPTAHDMTREHRVISALHGTAVPVPRPLLLCTDPDVLGAPFYVMERVDGVIARDRLPAGYAPPERRPALTDALVDVLADLHDVDPARERKRRRREREGPAEDRVGLRDPLERLVHGEDDRLRRRWPTPLGGLRARRPLDRRARLSAQTATRVPPRRWPRRRERPAARGAAAAGR